MSRLRMRLIFVQTHKIGTYSKRAYLNDIEVNAALFLGKFRIVCVRKKGML